MDTAQAQLMKKMMEDPQQNQQDINHFMKVYTFAQMIGKLEGLDDRTLDTLELAAIVHDIACPLCRRKFGKSDGRDQEREGMPLAREILEDIPVEDDIKERVVYLVGHHHTYSNVDGMDYQILLEADFLVNAGESEKYHRQLEAFRTNVFKTKTGLALLQAIYG